MRRAVCAVLFVMGAAGLGAAAPYQGTTFGNETENYSYDALGRLTGSSITNGPNNNRTTGTCFDRAGNRTRQDVATSTPTPCPTPTP